MNQTKKQNKTIRIPYRDIIKIYSIEGERALNVESMYDYGSRAGFWRLHRLFTKKKVPCTVFAVGMVRMYIYLYIYIWL